MRAIYLGNIFEYAAAIARIPGVSLAAVLFEGEEEIQRASTVAKKAGARAIRVRTDDDAREAIGELAGSSGIDLGIIANFGIILSDRTLATVRHGFLNFHPGLLPQQAGREPVTRLWKQGGGPSALTVHRVTAVPDAGSVLWTVPTRVDTDRSIDQNLRSIFGLGLPYLPQAIFASAQL